MALFKTKQFVAAFVWLAVVVLIYFIPELEPAANEIAAGWTLLMWSALVGVTWKDLATIAYTQAGVLVAATPSKHDDKLYADATTVMLATGILKKTGNPDAPYVVDGDKIEEFLRRLVKGL